MAVDATKVRTALRAGCHGAVVASEAQGLQSGRTMWMVDVAGCWSSAISRLMECLGLLVFEPVNRAMRERNFGVSLSDLDPGQMFPCRSSYCRGSACGVLAGRPQLAPRILRAEGSGRTSRRRGCRGGRLSPTTNTRHGVGFEVRCLPVVFRLSCRLRRPRSPDVSSWPVQGQIELCAVTAVPSWRSSVLGARVCQVDVALVHHGSRPHANGPRSSDSVKRIQNQ